MILAKPLHRLLLLLAFALLMLVTRSHHIASQLHLPDASVALFFLGGLVMQRRWGYLGAMLIMAGGIDYWATNVNGVSSFCMTPAYLMLVPTYALLWWSGDWAARQIETSKSVSATLAGSLLASTFAAHLLSSGSFYFFSGRFAETSVLEFLQRTGEYAPTYVGFAVIYVCVAVIGAQLLSARNTREWLNGHG